MKYSDLKEETIQGRYVTHKTIESFLQNKSTSFQLETIGSSVELNPIQLITIGTGPFKILMWSQMHGNESTTTKAVLDFINFMDSGSSLVVNILERCTIKIIPILNPDGAIAYTRVNANQIDLNRDAQELSQPESKALRKVFDRFQPNYAFNLHDQRTIFNVGETPKPATVSFLAPAHDAERSISETRAVSMRIIVAMNDMLNPKIPGQIGRFDDSFNSNCVGDCFQMLNIPTILFEAGHFPDDYEREKTREYIFWSIYKAVEVISTNTIHIWDSKSYFDIPENNKFFFDILIKEADVLSTKYAKGISLGILYKEVLQNGKIEFEPYLAETGKLEGFFGHKIYNCKVQAELEQLNDENLFLVDLIS